jgi:outer membrane protein TolC
MKNLSLLLAALLGASSLPAEALTWKAAAAEAAANNPTLASARLAVKQAESGVTLASAGLWPSLNAGAGFSRGGSAPSGDPGLEADHSGYQGALTGSWNLFNGFGTLAGREESLKNLEGRRAAYGSASAALRQSLRQAFLTLLYAQKNADLLSALGARYHQDTLYQQLVFKSGRTALWTFLKAQSDEAEIQWEIRQNSLNLESDRAALAALLGREPAGSADLSADGSLDASPPPLSDAAAMAGLATTHPAALAAQAQLEAAQAALKASEASRYPSLSASGSYGASGGESWGPGERQWSAGLNLNFNLFSGGAGEAGVSQAKLEIQAGQAGLQSELFQLEASVRKAWANYQAAFERLPVSQMAADAGQERFKTVQKLYEAGRTAFLDYEQAESIYSQAQQQLLSAKLGALQAQIQFEFALGLGLEAP